MTDFDDFWDVYPRHVARGQAEKTWAKVIKRDDPEKIVAAAREYAELCAREGRSKEFIKHPSTWLNSLKYPIVLEDERDELNLPEGIERERHFKNGFVAIIGGKD